MSAYTITCVHQREREREGGREGKRCELITIEVGSREMLSVADLELIQAAIDAPRREIVNLCLTII